MQQGKFDGLRAVCKTRLQELKDKAKKPGELVLTGLFSEELDLFHNRLLQRRRLLRSDREPSETNDPVAPVSFEWRVSYAFA